MSKRGYISRYLLILKKLKANPNSSFEELKKYIENNFEYMQMQDETLQVAFGLRTFQRDVREIRNNFGIDIEYSRENKGYFISNSESENMNFQRRMDAFDMFNSLNLAQDLNQYIHLERRRPQGTEHIYGILHAIKNKVQVAFSYQKFWEAETTQRILEPYGLKEFRQRWYVMGKEKKNGEVRTFGLDRITNLDVTNRKFEFPANFNIEEYFKYSFGIIGPNGKKPEEIILSFDAVQGKYIKTLPLHVDQEILFENKDELRLKLLLFITDDLIMELLSFGENMMVIKPKSLAKLMKDEHKKAYQQY